MQLNFKFLMVEVEQPSKGEASGVLVLRDLHHFAAQDTEHSPLNTSTKTHESSEHCGPLNSET